MSSGRKSANRSENVDMVPMVTKPNIFHFFGYIIYIMPVVAAANRTVAIVGCGIAGATAVRTLIDHDDDEDGVHMTIHVFDQGRGGMGGRASSRSRSCGGGGDENCHNGEATATATATATRKNMRWDHGCQFFRADTARFRTMIDEWTSRGMVREWDGNFVKYPPDMSSDVEFFGLPSKPPFYVGVDGMQSLVRGILDDIIIAQKKEEGSRPSGTSSSLSSSSSSLLCVFEGTRVARLERITGEDDDGGGTSSGKWRLWGTSGIAAYHDTPAEDIARSSRRGCNGDDGCGCGGGGEDDDDGTQFVVLGEGMGYDAIILTDASSSFDSWHRASAGLPEAFAHAVRERLVSRVPLFAAMVAFDAPVSDIPFDASSFDDPIVWFAARSNSKSGMMYGGLSNECW